MSFFMSTVAEMGDQPKPSEALKSDEKEDLRDGSANMSGEETEHSCPATQTLVLTSCTRARQTSQCTSFIHLSQGHDVRVEEKLLGHAAANHAGPSGAPGRLIWYKSKGHLHDSYLHMIIWQYSSNS